MCGLSKFPQVLNNMLWKRPAEVPIGQVWSRFKGRERAGIPAHLYQIRDMDESIRKVCLDMMQEVFLRDEPLCEVLGIDKDPESITTIRQNWENIVSQNVSLACFTEVDGNPGELVGFNVILVKSIDDEEEDISQVKGEPWKKLLRTLMKAENLVNVFEYYNVDKFLTSSGLTVLPGHRGQNIGAKLFQAREPLAKALDIKASATVFTAVTSQVLAAKSGYQELAVLEYKDMLEEGIDLTKCECSCAKLMGIKFDH
ncbi:hypothetical protein K1T71_000996 [Dendrolimus kikuchii]|uniref:Uncharacterized protein n=1 Tax=Dendrolimus kikuchii TaxID=765133 RepID=A0ACC1DGQ3_9NEOP|nr:hypothetical protein K1T71_000996 [Dendrolimus kikuchii]